MFSRSFARLTCAVLAVSGTAAFAADAPPATSEAETDPAILVVGQRDRRIEIAPRGLSVSLGEDQFAGVNAFNVEDLMKYAPNFFVRKRFIGDSNGVPGFRGTHSTQSARTLVMLDGFVVSNFLGQFVRLLAQMGRGRPRRSAAVRYRLRPLFVALCRQFDGRHRQHHDERPRGDRGVRDEPGLRPALSAICDRQELSRLFGRRRALR